LKIVESNFDLGLAEEEEQTQAANSPLFRVEKEELD